MRNWFADPEKIHNKWFNDHDRCSIEESTAASLADSIFNDIIADPVLENVNKPIFNQKRPKYCTKRKKYNHKFGKLFTCLYKISYNKRGLSTCSNTDNRVLTLISNIPESFEISLKIKIEENYSLFPFEVDSGASRTLITRATADRIPNNCSLPVANNNLYLSDVNGRPVNVQEIRTFTFLLPKNKVEIPFLHDCVIYEGNTNLLGLDFLQATDAVCNFSSIHPFIDFFTPKSKHINHIDSYATLEEKVNINSQETVEVIFRVAAHNSMVEGDVVLLLNSAYEDSSIMVVPTVSSVTSGNHVLAALFNRTAHRCCLARGHKVQCLKINNDIQHAEIKTAKQLFGNEPTWKSIVQTVTNQNLVFDRFEGKNLSAPIPEPWSLFYKNDDLIEKINKLYTNDLNDIDDNSIEDLIGDPKGADIFFPEIPENNTVDLETIFAKYPPMIRDELIDIFKNYPCISTHPWEVGRIYEKMHIPLAKAPPKTTFCYPMSDEKRIQLKAYLDYLLFYNLIIKKDVTEQWGAPVFLIQRKNKQQQCRLLVDLRNYNKCLKGGKSAIFSSIYNHLHELSKDAKYISTIDLRNAYYAIPLSQETIDSGITSIVTPFGCFQFVVAMSGHSLVPSFMTDFVTHNLHRNDENEFSNLDHAFSFYDDIYVCTKIWHELVDHFSFLRTLVSRIHRMGFRLNLNKCEFCVDLTKTSIKLLGFQLSNNQLRIPDEKLEAMKNLPKPVNLKSLQSYLGSLNFFRNLLGLEALKCMAILATKTEKGKFSWDDDADAAFEKINSYLVSEKITLSAIQRDSVNVIFSDASQHCVGGVMFNAPLQTLNILEDDRLAIEYREIHCPDLKKHVEFYDLPLQQIGEPCLLLSHLLTEIFSIFEEPEPWDSILKKCLTTAQYQAQTYQYSLHDENSCTPQEKINLFFNSMYQQKIHPNMEDFLFLNFGKIMERQILLIITSKNYKMKTKFTKIGVERYKTPLVVAYNLENKKYTHLGFTKKFNIYEPTNIKYIDKKDGAKIGAAFFKALKTNKDVLKNFKVGGYFSKSLSYAERLKPTHVREGLGILWTLEYFKEFVHQQNTFLLTDSEPCKLLFNNHNFLKNKYISKLGLHLLYEFPNVSVVSVEGRKNISDFLSRMDPNIGLSSKNYVKNEDSATKLDENSAGFNTMTEFITDIFSSSPENEEKSSVKLIKVEKVEKIYENFFNIEKIKVCQRAEFSSIFDEVLHLLQPFHGGALSAGLKNHN